MTTAAASVSNQMRDKVMEIKDGVVDLAGIAKDGAQAAIADVTKTAGAHYQAGVAKAGAARDRVAGIVQEHPGKTLLACVCAGAIAGFLLARRR